MGISPARRLAFDVLLRVETEAAYASELLHARLNATGQAAVQPTDAALATELVFGALRWQRRLDFLLDRQLRGKSPLDPEVRIALRLGAYQLLCLTRVPARAAVNESVDLAKAARKRSAAGLVNAVLRRLELAQSQADLASLLPPGLPLAERLGITHSHPTWLVQRWLARWDESRVTALLSADNSTPPLVGAFAYPERRETTLEAMRRAGVECEPAPWLLHAIAITSGARHLTPFLRRGAFHLQDEASQMVAHLLGVHPGHRVLDLCAAPGGKTLALARAASPGPPLIAADLHLHRLRAMRRRLASAGVAGVRHLALDASQPLPFSSRFDRILVDAPCSGTGTLARNPEIRWRLQPRDLAALRARQAQLLARALERLAPGGRLVYSTCSLEPEENEEVLAAVLASRPGFRPVSGAAELGPALRDPAGVARLFDSQGRFRTFPPDHGADGFFAVALEPDSSAGLA